MIILPLVVLVLFFGIWPEFILDYSYGNLKCLLVNILAN
jgi:hypothetical protein